MDKKPLRQALTTRQAAEISGISPGTLANWRYRREGPPYYKLRRKKVLYEREEFMEWLLRHPVLTKDALQTEREKLS
jgi:transposase